ncbi:HPP family protein [Nonomuraea sp. WAC 01424]|uniref:HPP family protein n=1 Tax=Nonomuraea sp. WAC 01424 TaxID=2203200 RepID=UPI000F7B1FFE|nr:HPP family protein [Nonomuraea sp. WAC 01424]
MSAEAATGGPGGPGSAEGPGAAEGAGGVARSRGAVRARVAGALAVSWKAALCISVPALVAWLARQPFVFPSLGPTIYLVLTAPGAPASAPRRTVAGHAISAAGGYLALTVTGLTRTAPDLGHIDGRRVLAVVIALSCTTLGMLATDSSHPPGGATTLIVALGFLRTPLNLAVLLTAVVLTTFVLLALGRPRRSSVVASLKKLLPGRFIFSRRRNGK